MGQPANSGWHISKTVNVTVLLSVAVQTAAIIWGAAKLDSRVESIEKWIVVNANTQVSLVNNEAKDREQDRRIDSLENRMERQEGKR